MFLSEPRPTNYDLNFQIAGIDVRVHPLFWLMGVVLGASGGVDGVQILIWIFVLFFSILIHELGHALVMRRFGETPRIVLYLMGGLAIADVNPYRSNYHRGGRNSFEQIVISLAGPGAGFLLAAVLALLLIASGGRFWFEPSFPVFWNFDLPPSMIGNMPLLSLAWGLFYINILWGLVNLLPVYPLDGGQISREIFLLQNPGRGMVQSLWVSVFVGAGLAIWGLSMGSMFIGFMFGSLAYSSFMTLQAFTGRGGGGWR